MTRPLVAIVFASFACIASVPAVAGPLEAEMLPKDAKWVIHVDFEAFSDSAIAERVRSHRPEVVERVHTWFEENCGTDPRRDIQSITLFSTDFRPHSGAMVITGDFDEAKVKSLLMEKRNVKQTEHEGLTFYTWALPHGHGGFKGEHVTGHEGPVSNDVVESSPGTGDDATDTAEHGENAVASETADSPAPDHIAGAGEIKADNDHRHQHEVTAVRIDGKQAVLAGSLDRAKAVVRLLNGDEPTLKADSKLLKNLPAGALVYGAAIDLEEISQHDRPFPILSQQKRVQWSLGERDDQMFETLVLVADRSKTAREMETAMQGLVALGKLWAGDLETLKELYDDTEIDRDGSTVTVEWEGDVEDVMMALDELRPRFQAWKAYREKMRR